MNRSEIISALLSEIDDNLVVKTIVLQDTIWDKIVECRCFTADGGVYAAMYENDKKITPFKAVPKPNQEK